MNNQQIAQKVMDAFYSTFANERQDFIIQKLNNDAVANAIRVLADELSYTIFLPGNDCRVIDSRAVYDLCGELEKL